MFKLNNFYDFNISLSLIFYKERIDFEFLDLLDFDLELKFEECLSIFLVWYSSIVLDLFFITDLFLILELSPFTSIVF